MFENPTRNLGATQELKKTEDIAPATQKLKKTNEISPKEGGSFEDKGTIKLPGKKIEDIAKTSEQEEIDLRVEELLERAEERAAEIREKQGLEGKPNIKEGVKDEPNVVDRPLFYVQYEKDKDGSTKDLSLEDYIEHVDKAKNIVEHSSDTSPIRHADKFNDLSEIYLALGDVKYMGEKAEKFLQAGQEVISKYKDINLSTIKDKAELEEIQNNSQQELEERNQKRADILPHLKVLSLELSKKAKKYSDLFHEYSDPMAVDKKEYDNMFKQAEWLRELNKKSSKEKSGDFGSKVQDMIKSKTEKLAEDLSEKREVDAIARKLKKKIKEEGSSKELRSRLNKIKKKQNDLGTPIDIDMRALNSLKELIENVKSEDLGSKIQDFLEETDELYEKLEKKQQVSYPAGILQNACFSGNAMASVNLENMKLDKFSNDRLGERLQDLDFEENAELWQENKEGFENLVKEPEKIHKIYDIVNVLKKVGTKYGEVDLSILKSAKESGKFDSLFKSAGDDIINKLKQYDFQEIKKALFDLESGEYHHVYDEDFTDNQERVRKVDKERLSMLENLVNDLEN